MLAHANKNDDVKRMNKKTVTLFPKLNIKNINKQTLNSCRSLGYARGSESITRNDEIITQDSDSHVQ